MGKPKLFLATPCNRVLPYQYVESFAATWRWLSDRYDLGIGFSSSPLVYLNRNKLFMKAYTDAVDYMLFVDSDMDWRWEMVHRMVNFDKDVVTGVCMTRKPLVGKTHLPALYKKYDNRYQVMSSFPNTPFRVDACGTAFLLIRKNVITKMVELRDKLGYPFDPIKSKDIGMENVDNSDMLGEDLSFCYRLGQAGFEILCMPNIQIGHLVDVSLGKG